MYQIPKKYKKKDVLHTILLETIRDNWDRIEYEYNIVLDYLGDNNSEVNVDMALLSRFRKDIRQDGPEFIETPDGIGSRLRQWLAEAFPQVLEGYVP